MDRSTYIMKAYCAADDTDLRARMVQYGWAPPFFKWDSTKTKFESWLKARLLNQNPGRVMRNIVATISSAPAYVTVKDGILSFRDIPGGAAVWSKDSFRLITDRSAVQNPNDSITWQIDFDAIIGGEWGHVALKNVPQ